MKVSQLFGRPSKNDGAHFKIDSHRLLIQAGFIRESTAGRYYYLPLGIRVHEKITQIVRTHMNDAGAQELLSPVLHPLELWQETNRTSSAGFELMQVKDRHGSDFALGGTAEEMMVDLVRRFNISYKDLPFNIYQFSMKFRDELRARGGLLRVREFVMKDAYSFGTEEQFEAEYQNMRETYSKIFTALGLDTVVAEADGGYIGGDYCHEFIANSDVGESTYFIEDGSDYVAHEDVAVAVADDKNTDEALQDTEEVEAVRGTTMEDGAELHGKPLWQQIKDVLFVDETNDQYVLAIIRGDFDVNETKLGNLLGSHSLRAATEEEVREDLHSEPGFISPVGIARVGEKSGRKLIIVADKSLRTVRNAYGGANEKHKDLFNMNIDRDYQPDQEADIALAMNGMAGPHGGVLNEKRGIEVGNIFQLGYHYTDLMQGATFTNESGQKQKYYMGCYGIGIGRTLAAIVERYHDEHGIIWPESIAPYQVMLVSLARSIDEEAHMQAQTLYDRLLEKGVEVLWDDRIGVRPGEKFADADLMGIPLRIVVSAKSLEKGGVEVKRRSEQEATIKPVDLDWLRE